MKVSSSLGEKMFADITGYPKCLEAWKPLSMKVFLASHCLGLHEGEKNIEIKLETALLCHVSRG